MMNEPLNRFQLNVLDYETSRLIDVDTARYMVFHDDPDGGNLIFRTEGCNTQDVVVALMALKQMLYEALKKELSALRKFETAEQFHTLFDDVFTDMMRDLLGESIELKDGEVQGQVEENDPKENRFE